MYKVPRRAHKVANRLTDILSHGDIPRYYRKENTLEIIRFSFQYFAIDVWSILDDFPSHLSFSAPPDRSTYDAIGVDNNAATVVMFLSGGDGMKPRTQAVSSQRPTFNLL